MVYVAELDLEAIKAIDGNVWDTICPGNFKPEQLILVNTERKDLTTRNNGVYYK